MDQKYSEVDSYRSSGPLIYYLDRSYIHFPNILLLTNLDYIIFVKNISSGKKIILPILILYRVYIVEK